MSEETLRWLVTWMWFLTVTWVSRVVNIAHPAKGSTTGVVSSCRENPICPATSVASYEMLNMVLSTCTESPGHCVSSLSCSHLQWDSEQARGDVPQLLVPLAVEELDQPSVPALHHLLELGADLLHLGLAQHDVIPPGPVGSAEEGVQQVLVDRQDDVVKVRCDVPQRTCRARYDWLDIFVTVHNKPTPSTVPCFKQIIWLVCCMNVKKCTLIYSNEWEI